MAKVFPIERYRPSGGESFFFDTNIWIYLFCPIGNHNQQAVVQYSRFFKKALIIQSKILVSSLVLSEFYNAYLKLELEIYKTQFSFPTGQKIDFRKTKRYIDLIPRIKNAINEILRCSERIDDCFTRVDINHIFDGLEKCDFNDKYYIELSNLCNLTVVTDDADFSLKGTTTKVLTANRKMLGSI